MSSEYVCPKCTAKIPPDRQFHDSLICSCGWTQTKTHKTAEFKQAKKASVSLAVVGGLLIAAFLQIANWDKYSLDIVPLKVKQWTNTASVSGLEKIVNICSERNKHSCVESAYTDIYSKNSDAENLAKLGHVQFEQEKYLEALDTYKKYFQAGGKDLHARYEYAQSLGYAGHFKKARKQYRHVLKSKPGDLQFTVARKYVELLIDNKQYKSAKYVINHYRRRSKSSSYWMANELKDIDKKLKDRRHAAL